MNSMESDAEKRGPALEASRSLFRREPETLDGYTPKFCREDARLHYRMTKTEKSFRGLGVWEEDDNKPPEYTIWHYITIAGHEFQSGREFYGTDDYDIIAHIANDIGESKSEEQKYREARTFLKENAHHLNCSKRYWKSWDHLQRIKAKRQRAEAILRQVEKALVIASANAVEVKAERSFSLEERQILLAEFNGGAFKAGSDD